jgi:acyl-CoA thioesterase-1
VLFVGTSLTAGLGLDPDEAYPALIESLSAAAGVPVLAVNAGVSGETSAGALQRIDWVLRTPADIVVIETGANDGLRALPVSAAKSNLEDIVDRVKHAKPGVPVLLVQMEAPRNLGQDYYSTFHDMYGDVAKEKGVALIPFLLDSVAGHSELNQGDGLHPNADGEQIVARNVWRALEPTVRALYAKSRAAG